MRFEPNESVVPGAAEPADATDPALETVRPGQPTPGRLAGSAPARTRGWPTRVGWGADSGTSCGCAGPWRSR